MQLKWLKKKSKKTAVIMKQHLSSDLQQVTDICIYAYLMLSVLSVNRISWISPNPVIDPDWLYNFNNLISSQQATL